MPSSSPHLGLACIQVLALLATRQLPDALEEATAGGVVAVVMNILQQQAIAGVLVSEVGSSRGGGSWANPAVPAPGTGCETSRLSQAVERLSCYHMGLPGGWPQ